MASSFTENTEKLEKRITKLESENSETDKFYIKIYEDYTNGVIDNVSVI